MAMLTVRVSSELKARIDKLAEISGRPRSYFVRELIERGIEEFELDLKDLEDIRAYIAAGGRNQKMYSMEEVMKDLGITEMDLKLASGVKKATRSSTKTSSSKNPKQAKATNPKPRSTKGTKTTKR